MTLKIKGSKVQKVSGGSNPVASTNEQKLSNQVLPCIHEWEVRPPRISKTVAEKRKDLARAAVQARRSGDKDGANSHVFEGKAAKHNKVADGDSMSGPKDSSKLYVFCKKCNHRDREVDHVMRDTNGRVVGITEAKSGNANIKRKQFDALQQICAQLGAALTYKIQRGDGTDNATKFLKENGMSDSNIIVI
jgi:hypothetical protein